MKMEEKGMDYISNFRIDLGQQQIQLNLELLFHLLGIYGGLIYQLHIYRN